MQAGIIINRLLASLKMPQIPDNYCAFDTETTGFDRNKDLIIEWGHCMVHDRKVVNRASFLINWYDPASGIPPSYIDARLEWIANQMRVNGRTWRITPELLKTRGMSPVKFIPWLLQYLRTVQESGIMFASHNGINYDTQMITAHFKHNLGEDFVFGPDEVFDTGAIEKASQMTDTEKAMPAPGEAMNEYFRRICYCHAPGAIWNLDQHVVTKYDMIKKYGLDPTKMHTAGEDSFALYCLMEEFRRLTDETRDEFSHMTFPPRAPLPVKPVKTVKLSKPAAPAAQPRVQGTTAVYNSLPVRPSYRRQRSR